MTDPNGILVIKGNVGLKGAGTNQSRGANEQKLGVLFPQRSLRLTPRLLMTHSSTP